MELSGNLNFTQRRELVFNQINFLMRNHPPIKQEIISLLDQVHKDFPELSALKGPMNNLPSKITITQFNLIPIFDILNTIEKEIMKKPFHSKRGKMVFSHLLWLIYKLYFKEYYIDPPEQLNDILLDTSSKLEGTDEIYTRSISNINTERIIVNIQLINQIIKELSSQKEAWVFREDIPLFYSKLNSGCKDQNDFIIRVQTMASIFEVDPEPIQILLPKKQRNNKYKSIKTIEKWLETNNITNHPYTATWSNIIRLRNNPPTHASINTEMIPILNYFKIDLPVDYSIFWDTILTYFIKSLEDFLRNLNSFL